MWFTGHTCTNGIPLDSSRYSPSCIGFAATFSSTGVGHSAADNALPGMAKKHRSWLPSFLFLMLKGPRIHTFFGTFQYKKIQLGICPLQYRPSRQDTKCCGAVLEQLIAKNRYAY
eukprot:GHVS01063711.1.p2 GENE.GHVS01063711.1~~GHVS01063711.1.p2  ORF type:complete len:115 (-),score=5.21 GHVS01063711.1:616-960(-)